MKLVLILAVCVVAVYAANDEQRAVNVIMRLTCAVNTNTNPGLVFLLKDGKEVKDPKIYDFSECFFKHIEFMDSAGNINGTFATETLLEGGDPNAKLHIFACAPAILAAMGNPGKSAYNVFRCYKGLTGSKSDII